MRKPTISCSFRGCVCEMDNSDGWYERMLASEAMEEADRYMDQILADEWWPEPIDFSQLYVEE